MRLSLVVYGVVGVALGALGAYLGSENPQWVVDHMALLLAGLAVAIAATFLAVQLRMNRFERNHELRAQAFAEAMVAEFGAAPVVRTAPRAKLRLASVAEERRSTSSSALSSGSRTPIRG